MKVMFRSQVNPRQIFSRKRDILKVFFPKKKIVFPCQYHSTNDASYPSSYTCCSYQKENRTKPGNFIQSTRLSGIGEQQTDDYFHCLYSTERLRSQFLLGYNTVKSETKLQVFPLEFIVNFMWSKAQYQHGRLAHLLGGSGTGAIKRGALKFC